MILTRILILPLVFIMPLLYAQGQQIADTTLHRMIRHGIDLSGQQRYSAAQKTFERAITAFPTHPAGYLNKAILLQVMSLDFETPVAMPEYLRLLEKVEAIGERMAEQSGHDAEGRYYIGMARSYIAYYHFRDGKNWLSGLSHGLDASSELEECLELNSKAYDAMTGVGTYRYWKSNNMSFLTWTPLVDDNRHAGIKMLRLAEAKAQYSAQQATNALIWIFIEEERWKDAVRSARQILRRYPKNRLFLWGLASAAEGMEDWATARSAYQRIVASIDGEVKDRRYIEIQARAKIALMHYRLGDHDAARTEASWVKKQKKRSLGGLTSDALDRIERRFEEIDDLWSDLH